MWGVYVEGWEMLVLYLGFLVCGLWVVDGIWVEGIVLVMLLME